VNAVEVRQLLVSRLRADHASTISRDDELDAAVAHWLLNPARSVPTMSDTLRERTRALVADIATPDTAGQDAGIVHDPAAPYLAGFDRFFSDVPYPPPATWAFTFIDLFAGIGGFRIAFQQAGGRCVFSSEWDGHAKKTYETNFGEVPFGDIRQIEKPEIPDHDVLCAGFPCQPFSLAGVSKKNSLGRRHGFEDETQGTLFFEIKEILRVKRPKAFMLENVKNLLSHDCGRTYQVIRRSLEDELGYVFAAKVVDGARWVPQHRERVFMVGFDPEQVNIRKEDIEIPEGPEPGYVYPELSLIIAESVDGYTLGPGTWSTLERHRAHHEERGNGFGYGMIRFPIARGQVTRTISARYHKDGAEVLIEQRGNRPRRLTIQEALQLQGYDPARFVIPVSATQAYRQIGNSVVVPAVAACARYVAEVLGGSFGPGSAVSRS